MINANKIAFTYDKKKEFIKDLTFNIEKGKITILPQKKSLDDMLAMVTPENIHSEVSTGNAVGKEEW